MTDRSLGQERSFQTALIDSHVAAATIAVLLLWSLESVFQALWHWVAYVAKWIFLAVAVLDIPSFSAGRLERLELIISARRFYSALAGFAAARLLSHFLYGVGPLSNLASYRTKIPGWRHDVSAPEKSSD